MSIFVFVLFSAVNGISFLSAFSFNAFRSTSSIHHKKFLVLVLRCEVLVFVLNTRLGLGLSLGLEIKVLVLILKKSLDYITGSFSCCWQLHCSTVSLCARASLYREHNTFCGTIPLVSTVMMAWLHDTNSMMPYSRVP